MILFIIGGLYSILLLVMGFVFGYWVKSNRLQEAIEEATQRIYKPKPPETSGPLKRLSQAEREAESDPLSEKMKQYLK